MQELSFCQSCYMQMDVEDKKGTENDGTKSSDYCVYCFQDGVFTTIQSYEEAVDANIPFWKVEGESDDVARERINAIFPTLKRWNV